MFNVVHHFMLLDSCMFWVLAVSPGVSLAGDNTLSWLCRMTLSLAGMRAHPCDTQSHINPQAYLDSCRTGGSCHHGNQVGAGLIFSGHVRVNQWSDFFGRGPIFFRTSIVERLVVILKTTLSPQHMFFVVFNVILIIKTTFNAHNN